MNALQNKTWIAISVAITAGILGIASRFYFSADNIIEQASEKIIHSQTGLDVDLSPDK